MISVSRRFQRLIVALPSSFTKDIPHIREKTGRVGLVARALSIFRVDEIVIYNDEPLGSLPTESRLFEKLLSYQETPPYIRKTLFAHDPDLQFAGILPPLRLPSHPNLEQPAIGMIREGVVVDSKAHSIVDAGFRAGVKLATKLDRHRRVTIRLTHTTPFLQGELIESSRLPIYWGFRVTRSDKRLGQVIRREKPDLTISTSRAGRPIRELLGDLTVRWKSARRPLVLFGSPSEGVPHILAKEGIDLESVVDFNLNSIPNQGVETVRTEEALFATLSELNMLEGP